jgi:hypothetical protein
LGCVWVVWVMVVVGVVVIVVWRKVSGRWSDVNGKFGCLKRIYTGVNSPAC